MAGRIDQIAAPDAGQAASWLCDLMAAILCAQGRANAGDRARLAAVLARRPDYAFSNNWRAVIAACQAWLDAPAAAPARLRLGPAWRTALDERLPAQYAWQQRADVA